MHNYMKILLTVILVAAIGLIGSQALDEQGQHYTSESLKRSLVTFGVARSLNGVISVAQGTEIALQPAGVGVTFAPGQILDPLNDLVERFSWVMLMSSASIGIQKTLLIISAWPLFSGTSIVLALATVIALWTPVLQATPLRPILLKFTFVVIILRLAVPLISVANELIYQEFLAPQYQEATLQLQQTRERIGQINDNAFSQAPSSHASQSLWDSAQQFYNSATESIDIDAKLNQYTSAAADASEYLINLIVVFMFQTVIFPLTFLAAIYIGVKNLVRLKTHSSAN